MEKQVSDLNHVMGFSWMDVALQSLGVMNILALPQALSSGGLRRFLGDTTGIKLIRNLLHEACCYQMKPSLSPTFCNKIGRKLPII
jgi:hypothetical protein